MGMELHQDLLAFFLSPLRSQIVSIRKTFVVQIERIIEFHVELIHLERICLPLLSDLNLKSIVLDKCFVDGFEVWVVADVFVFFEECSGVAFLFSLSAH